MSRSILQTEKECFFCSALGASPTENPGILEKHHIMFGFSSKARKYSEKYGLWVWLCSYHHRYGKESVHMSKSTNIMLRRIAQKAFIREHGKNGFNEWMELFGKNYLEEEAADECS